MKKHLLLAFIALMAAACSTSKETYDPADYHSPSSYNPASTSYASYGSSGQTYAVHTGKRGGKYYINSNGNKVYVKKSTGVTYHTKSTRGSTRSYSSKGYYRSSGGRRR